MSNHHISKTVRIGQVRDDGLFEIVSSTDGPIDPVPWNQYVPETRALPVTGLTLRRVVSTRPKGHKVNHL
jgi:hypothetical protein